MIQTCKQTLKKILSALERMILGNYYFSLTDHVPARKRIRLLFYPLSFRFTQFFSDNQPARHEITALVHTVADERMLIPLLHGLLKASPAKAKDIRINLILFKSLPQHVAEELRAEGCHIEKDHGCLLRACLRPEGKIVLLCLDQRYFYRHHKYGVDTADVLKKFRVKTVSIQHGGSREDSVKGLASSASDILLVFGKRIREDLTNKYRVPPDSVRLTGNPLHDRLGRLNKDITLERLAEIHPGYREKSQGKKVIFFAGCLHDYYDIYPDCENMYNQYVRDIYDSFDASKALLLVQPHPDDRGRKKLYKQLIPQSRREAILLVDSQPVGSSLDAYSLIHCSDLLITLASTLAEEALLLDKTVIAFDLLEEGRTKKYRHLEGYHNYRTVYATEKNALKQTVHTVLGSITGERGKNNTAQIIEDFAYKLDGRSLERAVGEILQEL